VVEVVLNDQYQAGIDWSKFGGLSFTSEAMFAGVDGPSNILDQLSFLKTFGDSKVLSSPKIMAINNQTALLKVVENLVYFTVDVTRALATTVNPDPVATYETEVHTVPVGFTMSVTPFVSEDGNITLNVRPTISRRTGWADDPNPNLGDTPSQIPIIQEKEMSSVLKLKDRQTAIIGGLIEDTNDQSRIGLPWLSDIPVLGDLFSQRDDQTKKSELVIFIRPIIIKNPDIDNGDLQQVGRFLKTNNY
jgi:general secretion pathway protein D